MKCFESYRMRWVAVGVVAAISICGNVRAKDHFEFGLATNVVQADEDADAYLNARIDELFLADTSVLVEIPTYRDQTPGNEEHVRANLETIRDYLNGRVNTFNSGPGQAHAEGGNSSSSGRAEYRG